MTESRLNRRAEATVRQLRTLLDEARGLLRAAPDGERTMRLESRITAALHEAEQLAPDLHR